SFREKFVSALQPIINPNEEKCSFTNNEADLVFPKLKNAGFCEAAQDKSKRTQEALLMSLLIKEYKNELDDKKSERLLSSLQDELKKLQEAEENSETHKVFKNMASTLSGEEVGTPHQAIACNNLN